jgi:hypothetical protein
LTGALPGAVALEVSLHLSDTADLSLIPLCRSATSIEKMFPPYDRRDRESDHKNQGESDDYDDGLAAIDASRDYAC